ARGSAQRRGSERVERRPLPQSLAQPLGRVLRQLVEDPIALHEGDDSPRGLGGLTDLLAALPARGRTCDGTLLVAEQERPAIHAAVLMLHASETITTPLAGGRISAAPST